MLGPQASSPAWFPPRTWWAHSRRGRLLGSLHAPGGRTAGEDACGPSISAPNSPEQLLKGEAVV